MNRPEPGEDLVDGAIPGAEPMLEYSRLDKAYKSFARWFSYLAGAALGVITIVCFIDVIGSKFFGKAIPSQFDLIANLNVVIVFLAVFYVQMDRGSVAIELLQDRFPRPAKLAVRVLGSILGAAVSIFCAYRGWYYLADFWTTHKSASGVWHFPIWPFQAVLVFGFFCLGLAFFFTVARDITDCRLRRGKFAPRERGQA
jgi:TRAP-type C4-dicarboxylate transport system permease small subunit